MVRKTLITAATLTLLAGPAYAFQCPSDMADVDAALTSADLSDADRAEVTRLRAEGEQKHGAGDHAGAVDALEQAKELLGIS
jgi:hypothetical protein